MESTQRLQDGWTALICAAAKGYIDIVKMLLSSGADVNLSNNDGWTALTCAAAKGYIEIVKTLLSSGADVNHSDKFGRNALKLATEAKRNDVVNLLSVLPLIWAARDGQQEVVKRLLIAGADVNHPNNVSPH